MTDATTRLKRLEKKRGGKGQPWLLSKPGDTTEDMKAEYETVTGEAIGMEEFEAILPKLNIIRLIRA
jgi:hypothetical protein